MAIQPPKINTYHCICSSLLLASTHTLSSLPRRSTETGALDASIILPLPPTPPTFQDASEETTNQDMPTEGYTMTLGMNKDTKTTIVRREDGFEKRLLWRCGRCRVVVGYELMGRRERMDVDGGNGKGKEGYEGRVMYVLPGGMMSTDIMAGEGRRPGDGDMEIRAGVVAAFE